ncbi:MAG: hypothetical protein PHR06_13800, partial [Candidatus Cloacimonetes bacterium]|nr:hypothetical protein [Candidatus Cloacimonadota bacterium]
MSYTTQIKIISQNSMNDVLIEDANNRGSIKEKRISDALEQKQYSNARVLWIHSIENDSGISKKEYTLTFLSKFFKSNANRDWSKNLTYIWRDIQKNWPESDDYIKIYFTAIQDIDQNTNLNEILLTSLLRCDHSRQIARECYRMSPKGSRISQVALAYMISNLTSALKKKTAEKGHENFNAISSSKILTHSLQFAENFPPIGHIRFSTDAEYEIVERIEQAIMDKYTSLCLFSEVIHQIDSEIGKKDREIEKIADSIRRIGASSGVSLNTDDPVEIFKTLSDYSTSLEKERVSLPNLITSISGKEGEIELLRQEVRLLEEIIDVSESSARTFGNVGKPVERFLAYCEDVTTDVLIQSLLLIQEKSQASPLIVERKLPNWFISEFDKWWVSKIPQSRESHPLPPNQRKPILAINDRMNEIRIVVPQQTITNQEELNHADLVIDDDTNKRIFEKEVALYNENGALVSQEIPVIINSPSPVYHIKLISNNTPLISNNTPLSWNLEAFTEDTDYLIFDDNSHRQILSKNQPTQRCILLTDKKLRISPDSIIRETGQLFGDWDGFTYFEIDPSRADSTPLEIGRMRADLRKDKYLEVQFDPQFFDEYLRINDRRVILGTLPELGISFDSEDTLLQTTISFHPSPLSQCLIDKQIVCNLDRNRHHVIIDKEKNCCQLILAQKELLGNEPVGLYIIRIRNTICRVDT